MHSIRLFGCLVAACAACTTRPVSDLDPREEESFSQRFGGAREVDVLFVIDSSGSMTEEQHGLSATFPRFVAALDALGASWRIGVTTTDMGGFGHRIDSCDGEGDGGRLRLGWPGCGAPADAWLWREGGRTNAPDGDVERAFACMAQVGTQGCAYEMPLLSAQRALAGDEGFVRDEALLAVIVVTDEDDCSVADPALLDPEDWALGPASSFRCFAWGVVCEGAPAEPWTGGPRHDCRPGGDYLEPPDVAAGFLRDLKPGRALLAVVSGPASPVFVSEDVSGMPEVLPSCVSPFGRAAPAVRLASAVQSMGEQGLTIDFCDGDFSPALDAIGAHIGERLASRCLTRIPAGACSLVADGRSLAPCAAAGAGACWRVVENADCETGRALDAPGDTLDLTCEL